MLHNTQIAQLIKLRHWLHQNPELSGQEYVTIQNISEFIRINCPKAEIMPVAKTGMVATFKGKAAGLHILLRGDIDALPIEDRIDEPYASKNAGVGHKCGHDGHAAILSGVAIYLENNPPEKGAVSLLFQPSEENGAGAKSVLAEMKSKNLHYDYAFALHNIPGEKTGTVLFKSGAFTPAVVSMAIQITGKQAHAAEPWNGLNPAVLFGDLLNLAKLMEHPSREDEQFALFTPVYGELGSKNYGISPGNAALHFTIRCNHSKLLEEKIQAFAEKALAICTSKGFQCQFDYFQAFASNNNDEKASLLIAKAANDLKYKFRELKTPFPWGEDFGLFTQTFKGAMFGIGAGTSCAALHHTDYNFPDDLIPYGVNMFVSIIHNAQDLVQNEPPVFTS